MGKRWKRGEPYADPTRWYLGEYVAHSDPKKVGLRWRVLLVVT